MATGATGAPDGGGCGSGGRASKPSGPGCVATRRSNSGLNDMTFLPGTCGGRNEPHAPQDRSQRQSRRGLDLGLDGFEIERDLGQALLRCPLQPSGEPAAARRSSRSRVSSPASIFWIKPASRVARASAALSVASQREASQTKTPSVSATTTSPGETTTPPT